MTIRLSAFAAAALLTAGLFAAEPLYVPQGGYAFAPAPVPESTTVPQSRLNARPDPGYNDYGADAAAPLAGCLVLGTGSGACLGRAARSGSTAGGAPIALYPHVRIVSPHKKHPCGVPQLVRVPNPLPRSGCCEPVYVEICVPPNCPPEIDLGPRGQRLTFSYGGYRVVVTSLRGVVTIDYDRRG